MSTRTTAKATKTRRGIQSVETGLRVLTALAASSGPVPLTVLGVRTGLSPSQTHRYLQSLVASGMAVQDASSRYDLGPGVIRIGISALARLDAFSRAEAAMRRFVEDTGRTGLLSVWGEAGAVCVRWFPGRPPVVASFGVGAVMPLLFSATGRVFLTFLSAHELESPLAAALAEALKPPELEPMRRTIRETLTAESDGDVFAGLRTVASPIFDMQGRAAVVATALATAGFPRDSDAEVAAKLRDVCRAATMEAGGVWPG